MNRIKTNRIIAILFLLLSMPLALKAQNKIELNGYYGFMLSGKLNTYYGKYTIKNSPSYGGNLSYELKPNAFIETGYTRSDSYFKYYDYFFGKSLKANISIEYYQIGMLQQLDMDKIKPFGTFTLGMTRLHLKDKVDLSGDGIYLEADDAYRFSITLGAGVKIFVTDRIGLRMQGRLLLPMDFNGLFISGGSGGTSGGLSFRVPVVMGDFTGGLIIRI